MPYTSSLSLYFFCSCITIPNSQLITIAFSRLQSQSKLATKPRPTRSDFATSQHHRSRHQRRSTPRMFRTMYQPSYPESAEITSLARVENGRSADEVADLVVYDVNIPTSQCDGRSNSVLCSLLYAPNYDETPILPGFYRITAKVCSPVFCAELSLQSLYPRAGG